MSATDNPGLVVGGKLNLSPIVNIALVLGYSFSPKTSDGVRTFSRVDFPSAASTLVQRINDSGQMVGAQRDANGVFHSLATEAKTLHTFDPPFSRGGSPMASLALGINGKNEIVGVVQQNDIANPNSQGYIKRGDSFTFFNHPNAHPSKGTEFAAINDAGLRVGTFNDTANTPHGFIQDDQTTTLLDSLPNVPANQGTWLSDVNNRGQMVGGYFDKTNGVQHGFLTDGKQFVTIDFPGTDTTWLNAINDSGQMAGAYVDTVAQVFRGFLTDGKTFTTVNYPNLPRSFGTFITGIDNAGRLVGYYGAEIGLEGTVGAKAPVHAFLAESVRVVSLVRLTPRASY
jgi:probable HAF family extracellular repeat protein